ncbi:nucleotidyltransferase family protein [Sporomusa sphaeroides]|jgi:GTP:adenosylcobinamide-phosphate guanylyltransferase|uniref:Molybdopterin-guanine dinucleotide biosynthesis protein A n=1 Tax=uncultured Sporomusa sp. TaxID=307249 RepID=A0A212LX21_9FIRM|nr:nucleotidyltransferase family protein [Sporomusa sphaeroides]SCM82062.1 Molybdopterin-guanine dinucleotide biosynthesis protein A [uncultured Sporomusa sp.]HML32666.1 nucleotidyltransferase family protein [Sporomusa sphaeroides]
MYDAIILAGGENNEPLVHYTSQPYEAMIDISGKPMVEFVARALAACPQISRIFVAGPPEELAKCSFPEQTVIVAGGRTIMDTISLGMKALEHERLTLVVTADIPLLTPAAIEDFLAQCAGVQADLYYPIVARSDHERRFPGNQRTYARLREGTFTGGNIFLVNPRIVPHCMEVAERIFANRKNPFKLCCQLGWTFVVKFVLGILKLNQVEKRAGEILGIQGAVIRSQYAELGIDVDKPSDLELVRNCFSQGC